MPSRPPSNQLVSTEAFSVDGTVLTVEEVAKALRVNTKTVYGLVKRGQLRAFRVGRALRCRRSEIDRFIKASEMSANVHPEPAREG